MIPRRGVLAASVSAPATVERGSGSVSFLRPLARGAGAQWRPGARSASGTLSEARLRRA